MQNPNNLQFVPEISNLIDWENSIVLSEEEQNLIRQLEKNTSASKNIETNSNLINRPQNDDHIFENHSFNREFSFGSKRDEMEQILSDLKEVEDHNSLFVDILHQISDNLNFCEGNLKDLSINKENLVGKINTLYKESSEIIEQQKRLLDFSAIIKSNLLYYTEYKRIEQDIDNIHLNLSNKEAFETNLQRYLSEIMDAIFFFEMKPNYKNSKGFLENYTKLKKRLLLVIKTLFLKIMNKEFTDISASLPKIQLNGFLQLYKMQDEIENSSNISKSSFLKIFYPEFTQYMTEFVLAEEVNELFVKINEVLRNLVSFIFAISKNDFDANEVLIDVFESYYPYYRTNILLVFLEKLSKFHAKNSMKFTNLLELFLNFSVETAFFEYIYHLFLFNFDLEFEKIKIFGFMHNFLEKFYDFIRPILSKEYLLGSIYESIDVLNNFQKNVHQILKNTLAHPPLKSILKNNQNIDYFLENYLKLYSNDLHLRVKQDLLQKLVFLIQGYIQEKIVNFDMRSYHSQTKQKKLPPFTNSDSLKRSEIFPLVQITIDLIENLKERMEKTILQEIIYEAINNTLNMLYSVAENFEGKFDSFLFLIKHLLLLNQTLSEIGIEILVKEQKLDFSETKNTLFELISGNYGNSENNIKPKESTWGLLGFLSRGMPKVNEYVIDVKKNLAEQINQINNRFLKDMSFIISKNICDFLRKYHYLKNLLKHVNNNEINLKKDLEALLNKKNIKKIYDVFYENFVETIDEIISKSNNYLDHELFIKVSKYLDAIIENVVLLLYQFYIIVAENTNNDDYKELNFVEIEEIRKELKKKIVFIIS